MRMTENCFLVFPHSHRRWCENIWWKLQKERRRGRRSNADIIQHISIFIYLPETGKYFKLVSSLLRSQHFIFPHYLWCCENLLKSWDKMRWEIFRGRFCLCLHCETLLDTTWYLHRAEEVEWFQFNERDLSWISVSCVCPVSCVICHFFGRSSRIRFNLNLIFFHIVSNSFWDGFLSHFTFSALR